MIRAWTGGSVPPKRYADPVYRQLRHRLFREQLVDWRDYWHDLPTADTCRIFWNRARYDAWATLLQPLE